MLVTIKSVFYSTIKHNKGYKPKKIVCKNIYSYFYVKNRKCYCITNSVGNELFGECAAAQWSSYSRYFQ